MRALPRHRWRAHTRKLSALTLLSASVIGCNYTDPMANAPVRGQSCDAPGDRINGLECRGGTWSSPGLDMDIPLAEMGAPGDMSADMSTDRAGCDPETDSELCAQQGFTCGVHSIVDACGVGRPVTCGDCLAPMNCSAQGVCVECSESACPLDLTCGFFVDACGQTVLCDQCSDGETCDPDLGVCECERAPDAEICQASGVACGEFTGTDACGAEYTIACGGCAGMGLCVAGACEQTSLESRIVQAGEYFGFSLALRDGLLLVGEPRLEQPFGNQGVGMLFSREPDGGFALLDALDASSTNTSNRVGYDVALAPPVAILGGASVLNQGDGVLLFEPTGGVMGSYTQTRQLAAGSSRMGPLFGSAISAQGERLVVGDPDNSGDQGRVHVFEGLTGGSSVRSTIPSTLDDEAFFGWSVALDGDTIAVGAPGTNNDRGSVAMLDLNSVTERWEESDELRAMERDAGDRFGDAVALEQDRLVVGIPGADSTDARRVERAGAVEIFEFTTGAWQRTQRLESPVPERNAHFGESVALAGDWLVIGAPGIALELPPQNDAAQGHAYLYARDPMTNQWTLVHELVPDTLTPNMWFGASVAIADGVVAVGAPTATTQRMARAGRVFLFSYP